MDGGYLEVEMMAQAGASWCVVMGVAHPATVTACVAAARQYGIGIMGDILAAPDKVSTARVLQELGVDVIIVHTGFNERRAVVGASPWDDLAAVVAAVDLPIQAVGGLRLADLPRLPAAGAPLVVGGAPLVIDAEAFRASESDDARLARIMREVVHAVTGTRASSWWLPWLSSSRDGPRHLMSILLSGIRAGVPPCYDGMGTPNGGMPAV